MKQYVEIGGVRLCVMQIKVHYALFVTDQYVWKLELDDNFYWKSAENL